MKKYKMGDMIKTRKGDEAVILELKDDGEKAIIFNLSKMRPMKIDTDDIKEIVNNPKCNVVVERIDINKTNKEHEEDADEIDDDEAIETLLEELEEEKEKHQETKDELILTLKSEVNFIESLVNNIIRKITE